MRLLPIVALAAGAVSAVNIQASGLEQTAENRKRADAVSKMAGEAFRAYRKYAWGDDQLLPMSLKGTNPRNGWGAAIIDSMSLWIIMGHTEQYRKSLEFVETIDFTQSNTDDDVQVFETTIRYLAGLISAYELDPDHPQILLDKAIELGQTLSLAWDHNNDIPLRFVDTKARTGVTGGGNRNVAEAGTLLMEFEELTKVSRNTTYRTLGQLTQYAIMNLDKPLPGFPAQGIAPIESEPVGDYLTIGGGTDSYIEYLLKYAIQTGNQDPRYLGEWKLAVDSFLREMTFQDSVLGNLYANDYSKQNGGDIYRWSHLGCFIGGNILMGGKLLNNQTMMDAALRLTETCYNTYASTATGIGPEAFCSQPKGSLNPVPGCNITGQANQAFFLEHGWVPTSAAYIHRPEVLESMWYAYRITGDTKWQDRAWEMFTAIRQWTRGTVAWTSIQNVNKIPPGLDDNMETFFWAELMKYFYLIFSDGEVISLDEYQLNTEAHPFPYETKGTWSAPAVPSRTEDFKFRKGALPAPSGAADLLPPFVEIDASTVREIPHAPANADEIKASLEAGKAIPSGHKRATNIH